MKLSRWIVAAFAVFSAAAFADNLVPEDKRDFDVPFKGAGQMSLVYTPVFFQKKHSAVHPEIAADRHRPAEPLRPRANLREVEVALRIFDCPAKVAVGVIVADPDGCRASIRFVKNTVAEKPVHCTAVRHAMPLQRQGGYARDSQFVG